MKVISALPTPIKPEFYLADTKQVNAFCLIDGTLIVTKGALKEFSDRELAFVIAHEYGHALGHHGAEGLTKAIASEEIQKRLVDPYAEKQAEEDAKWKEWLIKGGYVLMANLGIRLPYSRIMENEADALGLVYMKKAGYDPTGAVELMKHLQKLKGKSEVKWLVFLSTHPATSSRCERLETYLQFDGGRILKDAVEGRPEVALDWAYEGVKMLDETLFEVSECENAKGFHQAS